MFTRLNLLSIAALFICKTILIRLAAKDTGARMFLFTKDVVVTSFTRFWMKRKDPVDSIER